MQIEVRQLSKRFQREWIFRDLTATFHTGQAWAITGPNGSGKSTLLQVLSGIMPATSGNILYSEGNRKVEADSIYRYISYASPYLELVEELTLKELLAFHYQFKKPESGMTIPDIVEAMYLQDALNKQVRFFSSGMKQRLKLGLAFFSTSPIIILDEPTSNLDEKGIGWYREKVHQALEDKLLLVGSNQKYEYEFCKNIINLTELKVKG